MNKFLLFFLTISFFYLAACNAKGGTNTFTPRAAKPEQVIVYLYRPAVMSNAIYSPSLYINGEFKHSIKNGENTRLSLNAGEYIFELEPNKNYSSLTRLSLNLNSGTTYFLRVDTSLKIEKTTDYKPYQRIFNLINVDENIAINQITECCMNENKKKTDTSEASLLTKKTRDGFSVDKTQNPFSH